LERSGQRCSPALIPADAIEADIGSITIPQMLRSPAARRRLPSSVTNSGKHAEGVLKNCRPSIGPSCCRLSRPIERARSWHFAIGAPAVRVWS